MNLSVDFGREAWSRRRFLAAGMMSLSPVLSYVARLNGAEPAPRASEDVGVNLSSFQRQVRTQESGQRIDPFDLPRLLRDALDVRVIDLPTTTLNSRDHAVLARFRARADAAGCVITNLKVNGPGLPFDGDDAEDRRRAREDYKRWIDAAGILGVRWLRPFPAVRKPQWEHLLDGYRELADYAAPRGITLLVENYRWIEQDADVIPRLVTALAGRIAAQPDTGNWVDDATRRAGLARAFPHAVSADFKALQLGEQGEHAAYDLRACFEIGYAAGFRGPWCIEHQAPDRVKLLRELRSVTEMLRGWMAEKARR